MKQPISPDDEIAQLRRELDLVRIQAQLAVLDEYQSRRSDLIRMQMAAEESLRRPMSHHIPR